MSDNKIRNFAIIAHIDHGKSTLADRLLEVTGVLKKGHVEQFLDRNPISRERGITIKLAPVTMSYVSSGREKYILNLIDTPGHVDFSYEVDRTLACVEGAVLLVDATQGMQAQTIANAYKALSHNLTIIPVINKIDLPNAQIQKTQSELAHFLGGKKEEILLVSAKTGENMTRLLETILKIKPPSLLESSPLALIFDSYYDPHRGVIAFIRVFGGSFKKADVVQLLSNRREFVIQEVGIFVPELKQKDALSQGEIGYLATNLKDIHEVRVGDTISLKGARVPSLTGYKKVKPMVFAALFPTDTQDYLRLKTALEKLYLNDSSLEFYALYSQALGAGFRVGFLGLLHAEVVRERLEREFNLNLVLTPPQVEYKFENNMYQEPVVKILILTPQEYVGAVMQLCEQYRGRFVSMDNQNQISLIYEMPLPEMISDFFDNLKSVSSGYASLDWEFLKFEKVNADKLSLLINGDPVEEFSEVLVAERAVGKAQVLVKKIREIIPRQQFEVKIQAQYRGKIIASERVSPFRKDVTKKLYGGDRTRKDKLLEKQKEGKQRLKMIGHVEIPKEAFLKLFRK
ncbi:elongation factor 4 [Candidatus Roizmanbacteria bacterium]|nr:elongation factor 4 [Candidatus Roizmanbacteria bacterium]